MPASWTANQKNLIRRYLIWCYKTTKEDLDRIDRYFTQIKVDDHVLKFLQGSKANKHNLGQGAYRQAVEQFQVYMQAKETKAKEKKFVDSKDTTVIRAEYQFLADRFAAIQKAVRSFLGPKALKDIERLYEQEMTRRILEAKEHS